MCWSASADLLAGSGVVSIGLVGVALARNRRDVPLATLPLLLGIHQLVEARIWSESTGPGAVLRGPAVLAWELIAFVVLPVFVPLAVLSAERRRHWIQYLAVAIGLPVAVVMGFAVWTGAEAADRGHVMQYAAGIPELPLVVTGYLLATCLPFLASRERALRELGVVLVVGAAATVSIDVLAFASTWCAFAAVVSLLIARRTMHATATRPLG